MSLYADNTICFLKYSVISVKVLNDILEGYGEVLQYRVNEEKSIIQVKHEIRHINYEVWLKKKVRYLGICLSKKNKDLVTIFCH